MTPIRITPDREQARNIYKLALHRYKRIIPYVVEEDATIIIETYYEIIKEFLNAHFLLKGYKAINHKEFIDQEDLLTEQEKSLFINSETYETIVLSRRNH